MTPVAVLVAALGLCAPIPAGSSKAARDLAALERKLHGDWAGQGPCDGRLAVRADGTYRRTGHRPAGTTSAGTWALRWDALPPTLALTCDYSEDPAQVGKVLEVEVTRLDDERLEFRYKDQAPARFLREAEAGAVR